MQSKSNVIGLIALLFGLLMASRQRLGADRNDRGAI